MGTSDTKVSVSNETPNVSIASCALFLTSGKSMVSSRFPKTLETKLLLVTSIFSSMFSATVNPGIRENS